MSHLITANLITFDALDIIDIISCNYRYFYNNILAMGTSLYDSLINKNKKALILLAIILCLLTTVSGIFFQAPGTDIGILIVDLVVTALFSYFILDKEINETEKALKDILSVTYNNEEITALTADSKHSNTMLIQSIIGILLIILLLILISSSLFFGFNYFSSSGPDIPQKIIKLLGTLVIGYFLLIVFSRITLQKYFYSMAQICNKLLYERTKK